MDLTLSTQVRQRLFYTLLALGLFGGGIGATKGWDAWQGHQAEHAQHRFNTQIITALVAQHPEVAAAIQRAQQAPPPPPAPTSPPPASDEPDPTEPDPLPESEEETEPDVDAP